MKIVFLKNRLSRAGGLEKYTVHLSEKFALAGLRVTILSSDHDSFYPLHPLLKLVTIKTGALPAFYRLKMFDRECQKYLTENSQDFVFGMERNSFQTHYRAGSGVHAHYLNLRGANESKFKQMSHRFNPLHKTILSLERKCFENPELRKIFTNSEMVKREILHYYKTAKEKIEVIYNGAPYTAWKEAFERSFLEKREGVFEFLFIGGGYKRKGLHYLLKGLALLKTDFHLTVIGYDSSQKEFEKYAHTLGLSKKISFLGEQSDLIPFYQKADSLVIPSIYDPCAGVTLEALAMGLFVVSSKYNGGAELIKEGAIIEDLNDPQSVAQALQAALLHPKTMKGAWTRRESIKELDFSNQLDKIVQKTLQT